MTNSDCLQDTDALLDRTAIRDVIESWAIWRDTGDFDSLATTWHPGGTMTSTWFSGPWEDFVARARAGFAKGNMSSHVLGGTAVRLAGARAVAQTRMTISSRETIEGSLYDIACIGRFYDLFERRDGRWAIVDRRLAYEKDRADPVLAGQTHAFDAKLLDSFPPGYRFLAYAQTKRGLAVNRSLPGLRGAEADALAARGARWLAGDLLR